jgi:HTH-type transcriptional regulator/antitoxin HigA
MGKSVAEVFPPGEFLKEELEARGWSQVELRGDHGTAFARSE